MKIYKVKVNGKVYEVELEAVSEVATAPQAPVAPVVSAPAPAPAPAPATAPAPAITGGATINAPIAGKLLSINVKVGDVIKKNQTVAVIEAMKLENEIPAPQDGKVVDIRATVGSMINNKDVLIVLQ